MKRTLAVMAATTASLMAFTGTAVAAPPDHVKTSSVSADAYWSVQAGDVLSDYGVYATTSKSGSEVHLWMSSGPEGGPITTIYADAYDSGFVFTADSKKLSGASLTATDLPACLVVYDPEEEPPNGGGGGDGEPGDECLGTLTTIDVDIDWAGQGRISRGGYNEHQRWDGGWMNVHVTWTSRDATAWGSFGGDTVTVQDLMGASLGTEKQVKKGLCADEQCGQ